MSRAQPRRRCRRRPPPTEVAVGTGPTPPSTCRRLRTRIRCCASCSRRCREHPLLARLLAQPGLVRGRRSPWCRLAMGRRRRCRSTALRPAARLTIDRHGPSGQVDPASYARWDVRRGGLDVDPSDGAREVYVNVKPLFDQAYPDSGIRAATSTMPSCAPFAMLGHAGRPTRIPAARAPAYFEHEDAALRRCARCRSSSCSSGPDNRQKIMAWLKRWRRPWI